MLVIRVPAGAPSTLKETLMGGEFFKGEVKLS
jgi:hypothetical protein